MFGIISELNRLVPTYPTLPHIGVEPCCLACHSLISGFGGVPVEVNLNAYFGTAVNAYASGIEGFLSQVTS